MRQFESTDRGLIDLRDERDHLDIQISLFKDGDRPDPAVLIRLQRDLDLLDLRIARRTRAPDDA